ncbi:MAX dimerization protein MGA a isoform X2 [Tachysurus fulvidraco]|uniref:MAX dimerization protein MGA a isoform X2 n=1 Tax=Tachysurus fulvidraco TaxID=1234273 RepID=UPI001FEE969A|nr:MAX dimerization protein MGA a isoform X2 [Tachysurus fulvidraco]
MAIPHNQAIMVLRQEGTATATVPQTSACSLFVVVNQLHPAGGGQDKQTLFASTEASPLKKPAIGSCVASFNKVSSMSLSAMAATNTSNQLCNLPAESTCKGITVTLDNNNMWNEFFRCQTEMILTKQGRRMFPCCRFRISGLEPFQRYSLIMDMQPVDNYRYKWSDRRWETNGKADPHILSSFVHPISPATGLDWMQNPVSFYKLKLTNNPLDREGHIIINSMHRYIPRLYIIPADKAVDVLQLDGPDVVTFSFSQTEFFAVTAYQNLSITQLKIDYNPFAKGFRDDANNSRCCKPKSAPSTEKLESEVKSSKESSALNNLKSLFAKMNASEKVNTIGDLKTVICDDPRRVEPECSGSMKRPWPGGLSDLIKGAHVKVKRISLEKIQNGSSEQMNVDTLVSKENNMDMAPKDCTSENISIPDVTKELKDTVSFSKTTDSSTLKNTPETLSATNIQCMLKKTSITPLNEKLAAVLSDTPAVTEKLSSEKTSQCVVKPLDCGGEVKKKRAEPVPLPLLALFLQQLKSKTRPKPKSESCSVPSQSDQSCDDTSVYENPSSPTASITPAFNTQLNVELASSPSQTITSSSLTCTAANTEHKTVSTPDSAVDAVTALTDGVVCDSLELPTSNKVSATTFEFAHDVKANTSLSETTLDTKIVSIMLDDTSSDCVIGCDPKAFPFTTPDAPNNELLQSTATIDTSSTEPADNYCTVTNPELVPETALQSPCPGVKNSSSPSCAPSPPYVSAPSSPDPFPPSMFSDRPIPPRKTLDPFPACVSLDRPRPLLEISEISVPQRFFTAPLGDPGTAVFSIRSELNCPIDSHDPAIPKEVKQPQKTSKCTKSKILQKKGGKSKVTEDTAVMEGPIPVPMQPNLEEVEGQLFVSFMSKKALEIHLGDEAKEEVLQKTTQNIVGEVPDEKEKIDTLEKTLLHDLKNMKYRQVIHPVLQAVGLKLNLLDVTLSIDLQYLGVCLPIPPPIFLPEGSSGTCSSQVHFVSRTGKTTDITKIKGWREKFSTISSTVSGVTTSLDTGQKNLSAFCSDMLDEYLESEGKLIDERAASFSQAVVTPVAYQLPTKSTSYVLTLDSVLKKQAVPLVATLSKPSKKSRKSALHSKSKEAVSGVKTKKSVKKKENPVPSTDKKLEGSPSKKSCIPKSVSSVPSTDPDLPQSKKSSKIKTKKRLKTSQHSLQTAEKSVKDGVSVASAGQSTSGTPGSNQPVGRSSGLPKTLVKLRDVEDGAVWEGKNRTYITMERAAIALSCLVTAEGTIGGNPSTVIKRRAPPCLNDFCRLGCICASLVQERRQHHCGKPQCMLGCNCLRRKVVLLKNEETNEAVIKDAEDVPKVKKKRKRYSYTISVTDSAPEPALHVKTLLAKQNDVDLEPLYVPDPAKPLHPPPISLDLQKDLENFLHALPKREAMRAVDGVSWSKLKNQGSLDCARVRPFCGRKLSPCGQRRMKDVHPDLSSQDSLEEIEEGELRPPTQSGPTKRLEIVSKCKWETEGSRYVVVRTVCERMAQDRLKDPFWVGKYHIQPTSKTKMETDEGTIITYKVVISQPHLEESEEKMMEERIKQLEAQLIETIGKSEVKGLPLLSHVTPAGLLKAEKKPSGALGQIMVNGKLYPQAKLELGQMGALHPANRLAAYITGRVCVANKHGITTGTTVTKTSHTAPTTPTSVAMTAVTNTLSSTITLAKPTVAKQPIGTEFVQVELGCINSQQQKTASTDMLPMQSTVKNLMYSSSMLTGSPGISASCTMQPKANIASHASPGSGTTDGSIQVVRAVTRSGSAVPEKTFMLSTTGSNVALSGSRIRLMQSLTSNRPAAPGQRMLMLKTANPTGRVIHLVPLGQFRSLNPNVKMHPQQSSLVRFPTPNPVPLSKPQTSTAVSSSIAQTYQNMAPVYSTKDIVATSSASTIDTKQVTPLGGSKTLLVCNKPNMVKIIPVILKDNSKNTLKIIPQNVSEDSQIFKDPRFPYSPSSAQSSSEGHPANQSLQPTSQSCLILNNPAHQKLDNPRNSGPKHAKVYSEEYSRCSKMSHKNVIFTDHSYTFEMKKRSTPSKKRVDVSKDGSVTANASGYHMFLKEVLDLGLDQAEGCGTSSAVLGTESGEDSKAGSHLLKEEIDSDTELTEDSDMYNDTDSSQFSDKEDLFIGTVFDKRKGKRNSVNAQIKDLNEKEDDELVDIETFEEGVEKIPPPPEQTQHDRFRNLSSDEENENENLVKLRRRKDEKKRRITLRNCFYNLQQTLNIEEPKVAKIVLLSKALEEIHSLTKQRDRLVKMWDTLRKKRDYYVEMASQLSGKNKYSICQKLDEIVAKQKSLEIKDKTNNPTLNFKKEVPVHSQRTVNEKQKTLGTDGKAEHVINSKQKNLEFQDRRTEIVNTNQKKTAAKPPIPHQTPQLQKCPPPVPSRERTRPNILSHSKPQALAEDQVFVQVIPVVETAIPCNQILTISNPLQPTVITTTPGVAAVSISIPTISHSLCVENPLPMLQPQVLKLTSSPVSTPVGNISLPKISSFASLLQSENLPVTPMQTQEECNSSDGKAQQNVVQEEKQLDQNLPEFVPKKTEHNSNDKIEEDLKKQKEDDESTIQPDQDDDRLMSLLDELVFLNQTSEPQEDASSLSETGDVLTELLTNKEVDMDRDDERSLSPLFLKLDEDLITSPTSKDEEMDDIPPRVDDLVKVIFGSESPSISSESEIVAAATDDSTCVSVCNIKHDAPTPPPLLQMKTGGCSTADSLKEQANLSWRPMPKLAPLGLKTQETGHPKLICPHAPK